MVDIFFPISRALLPIFHTNCPDGSHFAQMGSHFAQNATPKPCSLLSHHQMLQRTASSRGKGQEEGGGGQGLTVNL